MHPHPDNIILPQAQPKWLALFVSDVHLSDAIPNTTHAFLRFLNEIAIFTESLYILGDLFEYWAGDDDCDDPYHQQIIVALRELNNAGVKIYWIAGNRDFLVGDDFSRRTGVRLLEDPTELDIGHNRLIISHGDALCTDDIDYIRFRQMVRQPAWQSAFLAKSLTERKAIIQGMRQASNIEQKNKSMQIMDVNSDAVRQLFQSFPNATLIHGHTHRNAIHQNELGTRYVLPDWDFDHTNAGRGGYLRLDQSGKLEFIDLSTDRPVR